MDIKLLEKNDKENKLSFVLKDSTSVFANTLRRIVQEEVPTMAIEDVEFRKNSSILYDTIIAHRLGLIPLTTDLKSYTLPEKCKCDGKGCARCQVKMTLSAKGPCVVYTSDIKSKDSAIKPAFPKTPIVTLIKGQTLELEATAVLGKGKVHSKWSPGLVFYYNEPEIKVNNDDKLLSELKDKYPSRIFDKSGKIDANLINTPSLIDAVDGVSKLVEVKRKENNFVFHVESWGQLKCKDIILEAAKILNEMQEELAEKVKALK